MAIKSKGPGAVDTPHVPLAVGWVVLLRSPEQRRPSPRIFVPGLVSETRGIFGGAAARRADEAPSLRRRAHRLHSSSAQGAEKSP